MVGRVRNVAIGKVRAEVMAQWQERWQSSKDGRELYSFFTEVTDRVSFGWVEPDYVVSQILTGHGNFRSRLHKMSLCDTALCYCGRADETRDHVLWDCELYTDEREVMLGNWCREDIGPVYHRQLVASPEGFQRLRSFAHKWHSKRKALELQ
ncbi:hypothetical protein PYW08_012342 [Mythimna loreyi]|uniref:Uncharacterized protein n=1 Tax=Mythimna loreyi TaxID=667449 RepID=A0ACC2Q170_9NEOP|nr:hypothetical protein PYW08_012342 [Mythimna loreyi]